MTRFHLVALFAGTTNLLLALFVGFINPRRRLNQIFILIGLGIAGWNFAGVSLSNVGSAADALFRSRLAMLGVILLPASFYHLAIEATGIRQRRWILVASYIATVMFLALDLTPYFLAGNRPRAFTWTSVPGPGFWTFSVVFFPLMGLVTFPILIRSLKIGNPSIAKAARVHLVATSLLYIGGAHDLLLILGWDFYSNYHLPRIPFGTLAASCYGMLIGYSVLSDQLLDVRVSLSTHTATFLRLCFLGSIAYILLVTISIIFPTIFTTAGFIVSITMLLISAVITNQFFPKLLGGLTDRWAQRILGDQFEYQDKIAAFINSVPVSNDTQELLDPVANLLFDTMRLSAVGVAVVGSDVRTSGRSTRSSDDTKTWPTILEGSSPLLDLFRTTGLPQIDGTSSLGDDARQRAARSLLKSESLEAAFSIAIRPKSPSGLLVVGPRRDGHPLTKSDAELIQELCRNLAFQVERIAIIQTEELRESNKTKDQFLASINHEIRNPLNGITGVAQMLTEGSSDPRQHFLLSTLLGCTEQLQSTMDDVLSFTGLESGTLSLKNTDIVDLVKTTCASCNVPDGGVIIAEIPSSPILLQCDPGKVRQILSNYIANALKYGVPPKATVAVLVQSPTPEYAIVTLTVASTGPTLSREEMATLFTVLTRGSRARDTNAHGMGLGLAICKKLAVAMGGNVGVESTNGKTSFWFKAEFATVTTLPQPAVATPTRFAGRRALAIEDEPYNRLVLGHYLEHLGLSVTWAEDGKSALAALRDQPADVIFMDWVLPDIDGPDLLLKMKATLNGPLPPVVVVSAYSAISKRAECIAAGATDFISKPIDSDSLAAALDRSQLRSTLGPTEDIPNA